MFVSTARVSTGARIRAHYRSRAAAKNFTSATIHDRAQNAGLTASTPEPASHSGLRKENCQGLITKSKNFGTGRRNLAEDSVGSINMLRSTLFVCLFLHQSSFNKTSNGLSLNVIRQRFYVWFTPRARYIYFIYDSSTYPVLSAATYLLREYHRSFYPFLISCSLCGD
jgi:hypothetical protein